MAELVVPPLVRARLAAHALSPDAGDEPLKQVRPITEAIRHHLLKWRDHSFGVRLGGHLGGRESMPHFSNRGSLLSLESSAYPSSSSPAEGFSA